MLRYLRLFWCFILFSFQRAAAYRFDFWCRIIMDLSYYAVSIAFFKILYLRSSTIGGWNEQHAMVFVAGFLLIDALQMVFLSANMWALPWNINSGLLDYSITKPVSTLFLVSFRQVSISSSINLIFAVGIMVWAFARVWSEIGALNLISYFILLTNGLVAFYTLRLLFALPNFWLESPYGLDRVFFSLRGFSEVPDQILSRSVRAIMLTVLPFGLMASLPTRVLFGNPFSLDAASALMATGLLFIITLRIWNIALRRYGSASS